MTVSKDGLQSADTIRQLWLKLHDDNFQDATNRITDILQGDLPQQFLWHRDCRAKYMNKREIERKFKTELKRDTKQSSSASTSTQTQNSSNRMEAVYLLSTRSERKSTSHTRNESQQ